MREIKELWRVARETGAPRDMLAIFTGTARILYRHAYFLYFRCCVIRKAKGGPENILKVYVDPQDIHWVAMLSGPLVPLYGSKAVVGIVPGSWDRFRKPLASAGVYKTMKDECRKGNSNSLLRSMAGGYRENFLPTKDIRGTMLPDEVRLAVGRDNSLIRWSGGMHRIAAARILGIKRIPAYVIIWHADADRQKLLRDFESDV